MAKETVRADHLLVQRGLASSASQARALILAGRAFVGQRRVEKAGEILPPDAAIELTETPRFVSRGGDKLEAAIADFRLDVNGLVVADVGASTGGFTDCLLQHRAARVYAVDVGRGQLATKLRNDWRVVLLEKTNARHPFQLPEPIDLLVADVSFISLRLVLPNALSHLRPGGLALVLLKPQFEAGRAEVGKGGVVRDAAIHARVLGGFCLWAIGAGLQLLGTRPSAVEGESGNREFFVLLRKPDGRDMVTP